MRLVGCFSNYRNTKLTYLCVKQKQEDYEKAVSDCTAAIEISPGYVKALLRRAKSNEYLKKYAASIEGNVHAPLNDNFSDVWLIASIRLPSNSQIGVSERSSKESINRIATENEGIRRATKG